MAEKVIWSAAAETDLQDMLLFWVEHNKSTTYSLKLRETIELSVKLISKMPFLGKATDMENIRFLVKENYSVFYEVGSTGISILRIWDNRQNPQTLKYK